MNVGSGGKGLKAILDSCPLLETLHIDGYFKKHEMNKVLRKKCARVKSLTLPSKNWYDIYYDDEGPILSFHPDLSVLLSLFEGLLTL